MKMFRSAMVLAIVLAAPSANAALTWTMPLSLTTSPNLVGAIDGQEGDNPSISFYAGIGNILLGLSKGEVWNDVNDSDRRYRASDEADYTAPVIQLVGAVYVNNSSGIVPENYMYAIGKYDGKNAGYIVFHLNGEAAQLPTTSEDLWTNPASKGYGLSNFAYFNVVPEPATVLAGFLLLLPFVASILQMARRNRAA